MKKVVIGGFLSLIGSIWTLAIVFIAGNNLVSSWTTPGRWLTTISDLDLTFFFAVSILLTIIGILTMVVEYFKEEKK